MYNYKLEAHDGNGAMNMINSASSVAKTGNAIANAKLMRKKQGREIAKEEAVESLEKDKLVKEANANSEEGTTSEPLEGELTEQESINANALVPSFGEKEVKAQKASAFEQAVVKRLMSDGTMSLEQAELTAQGEIKDIQNLESFIATADINKKNAYLKEINENSKEIMSIMSLPEEQQAGAYDKSIKELDTEIRLARKNDNLVLATSLEKARNNLPDAWLGQKWGTNYLMTQKQKFNLFEADYKSKIKQKEEKTKSKNALKLSTHNAKQQAPKVITVGDKDISYKPDENGVYKEDKSSTSNALLKSKQSGSGSDAQYQKYVTNIQKEVGKIFKGDWDEKGNYIIKNTKDKRKYEQVTQEAVKLWEEAGKPLNVNKYVNEAKKKFGLTLSESIKNDPQRGDTRNDKKEVYDGKNWIEYKK